jgi:hypothetical protein
MPNKVFSHLDGQVLYHVTDKNSGTYVGGSGHIKRMNGWTVTSSGTRRQSGTAPHSLCLIPTKLLVFLARGTSPYRLASTFTCGLHSCSAGAQKGADKSTERGPLFTSTGMLYSPVIDI